MSSSEPRLRAPDGVYELIDLLRLAQNAIGRAQPGLHGEASNLAERLSRQLAYLRGVSDLLEHEATRPASCSTGAGGEVMMLTRARRLSA
ncbi:MAG: hypothetical protein QOD26_1186 [Betaproteobacteria bacterium]|nr:hypothetical protein [Betaproteobacteria bacterium]